MATFSEKSQVDLLFLGDVFALHIMDLCSRYSPLIPVRTEGPQEVRDAFCSSEIGIFGPPWIIQLDEDGEWKTELWAELRPESRI